jgi:hypothetical protein
MHSAKDGGFGTRNNSLKFYCESIGETVLNYAEKINPFPCFA